MVFFENTVFLSLARAMILPIQSYGTSGKICPFSVLPDIYVFGH